MIPETLTTVLAFLIFVVPGLTFELLRERRRPFIEETAFREASRIGLTSLLFSGAAALVLTLIGTKQPALLAQPAAWLDQGREYAVSNLDLVVRTILLQLGIATTLAFVADSVFRFRQSGQIVAGSIWFTLFRRHRPRGAHAWVHLRLSDETEVRGFVADYTPEHSVESRELVLAGPKLRYRRKDEPAETLLSDWSFLAVRGEEVVWMKVAYVDDVSGVVVAAVYPVGLVGKVSNALRSKRRTHDKANPTDT